MLGLSAKRHAVRTLAATEDPMLKELVATSSERPLNDEELQRARNAISTLVENLSENDRRHIAQGLSQSSKAGEARYIQELISTG
jgi:uncharacterized protein (DUF2336 family)